MAPVGESAAGCSNEVVDLIYAAVSAGARAAHLN